MIHLVSYRLIAGGFILIASAWKVLYNARKQKKLAVTGVYHYIRHPQYSGFILIILGFLLQWPTIITLLMAPVLIFRYSKLACEEEKEMTKKYKEELGLKSDAALALAVQNIPELLMNSWDDKDVDDIRFVIGDMVKEGILSSEPADDYLVKLEQL